MSSALGSPAFRRLWIAGLVSETGDWLLFIALPLVVYRLTGSALGTSLAFLLELAPAVLLAPLAARCADRLDRRRLMIAVNLGQAAALLPLLFVRDQNELWILYLVIAAQAGLGTLFEPAKNALLPTLVGSERLVSANGLVGLGQNLGRLVGGPLGGVLLAFGDLTVIAVADAASYLISAALVATMSDTESHRKRRESSAAGATGGSGSLATALRRPELRGALSVVFVASVSQGLFLVLFVLFVTEELHGDDGAVGILRGVQAIGAIGAGLALGFIARRADARRLTVVSTASFGVLSLLIWNLPLATDEFGAFVALFALVGAPGVVMMTGLMSALQTATDDSGRGAAFAAFGLVSAIGQGIGILLAGIVTPGSLLALLEIQAGLYLVAAVLAVWLMPRRSFAVVS
jgi:MFS family permease